VALELELDQELRREGLAREVVHAVQNVRKATGLQVEDRIELALSGDAELLAAASDHETYLAQETLATSVTLTEPTPPSRLRRPAQASAGTGDGAEGASEATIEGRPLRIVLSRART
jgi:isoleucyl-tRNA synthetase